MAISCHLWRWTSTKASYLRIMRKISLSHKMILHCRIGVVIFNTIANGIICPTTALRFYKSFQVNRLLRLLSVIEIMLGSYLNAMSYLDCGSLTNPTEGTVDTSAGTTAGNTASYSCNTGYNLMGNSEVQCLGNGSWEAAPLCQIVGKYDGDLARRRKRT